MSTEQLEPPQQDIQWKGVHDSPYVPVPPGFASVARNFYLHGGIWRTRPGLKQVANLTGSAHVQMVAHFQELDGTPHTVAIQNGRLFEYDWDDETWTRNTGLTLTVDPAPRISWVAYRGRLIVTDGVNRPWQWVPGTGMGVFTQLTEAPVSNGVMVYYDKLFFYDISGDDGNVFEWSDEGNPADGYDDDNQSWQFIQTDAGRIRELVSLNDHFTVFKEDSIADVRGPVEDAFQTDANREGVNETEGVPHRRCVVFYRGDIYYLTKSGPKMAQLGVRESVMAEDDKGNPMFDVAIQRHDRQAMDRITNFVDVVHRHIVWLWPLKNENRTYRGLLYSIEENAWSEISLDGISDLNVYCASRVERPSSQRNPDGAEVVWLGANDGKIYEYSAAHTDDAGTRIRQTLRSREYGKAVPHFQNRLVALDLAISGDDVTYTVSLMRNGGLVANTAKKRENASGQPFRYRRNCNLLGYTLGWQLEVDSLSTGAKPSSTCEVLSSVVSLSGSASPQGGRAGSLV